MSSYRLHLMGADGQIASVEEFDCSDEQEAIRLASAHRDPRAKELWAQDRHVRSFPSRVN